MTEERLHKERGPGAGARAVWALTHKAMGKGTLGTGHSGSKVSVAVNGLQNQAQGATA